MRKLLEDTVQAPKPVLKSATATTGSSMEVGLGRYETDEEGNQVLVEPLLHLGARDLALDLRLAIAHRFVRLATIVVDLNIGLALDIGETTKS